MTEEIRRGRRSLAPAMAALALTVAWFVAALATPPQAGAITRDEIISRARSWVDRNVPYSQHRTFEGYRTDCSGFVSMAWQLESSYTSRSIASRATRIDIDALQPGDAVHVPGHVAIFAGWANDDHTAYIALEESTWRTGSREAVRRITGSTTALRFNDIEEPTAEDALERALSQAVGEHLRLHYVTTSATLTAALSDPLAADSTIAADELPIESVQRGLTVLPEPVGR